MNLFPSIGLYILNGFVLVIPILIIRLGFAGIIDKDALGRLAFVPQTLKRERTALGTYLIVNSLLLVTPIIFKIHGPLYILIPGLIIYLCGVVLLTLSIRTFSKEKGYVSRGTYQYSRNPIYVSYFLLFIGIGLCVNSIIYIIFAFINQWALHHLILSEERWCHSLYPEEHQESVKKVKRYFGKKQ